MSWSEQLPVWHPTGDEPSEQKKTDGWQPEEKPPAGWFNWLFNRIYKCIVELRGEHDAHKTMQIEDVGASGELHGLRIGSDNRLYFWDGSEYVSVMKYADISDLLSVARLINGIGFDGGSDITIPVNLANRTADESGHLIFTGTNGTGNQTAYTNANLRYNPSNGYLSATRFVGSGAGLTNVATTISGMSIDANKDWNGKDIFNVNQLRASSVFGVAAYPPTNNRITVPTLGLPATPVVLYSSPGSVTNPYSGDYTAKSYTIPTNLSTHGISSLYSLVKIGVSYTYASNNTTGAARIDAGSGGAVSGGSTSGYISGGGTRNVSTTCWVVSGQLIRLIISASSGDSVTVSNFAVTLLDAYPYGNITSAQYATIGNTTGTTNIYRIGSISGLSITATYDGITYPSSEVQKLYPQNPTSISITKDGTRGWFTTLPTITLWKL